MQPGQPAATSAPTTTRGSRRSRSRRGSASSTSTTSTTRGARSCSTPTATTWGCTAFSNSGHTCTASPPLASFPYQYFLNLDADDATSRHPSLGCVALRDQRHLHGTAARRPQQTDGNDVDLRRPRQRLAGRRHRQGRPVRRLGQRPAERRRRAHDERRRSTTLPDDARHVRGPRVRRRRPRHPDRQHRRRPPDRLGRRVQQLHRAVRAVRHRHGQPPGRAAAARVPVRALGERRRRPDARLPTPAPTSPGPAATASTRASSA